MGDLYTRASREYGTAGIVTAIIVVLLIVGSIAVLLSTRNGLLPGPTGANNALASQSATVAAR